MTSRLGRYLINGKKLTKYRKELQIRPSELARRSGFEPPTIAKMEAGGVFYYNTIEAVCRQLDIRPELLELKSVTSFEHEPREFCGYRSVCEDADKPMYFTDEHHVVQFVNQKLLSLLNFTREMLVGYHLKTFLDHFSALVPNELVAEFVANEKRLLRRAAEGGFATVDDVAVIRNPNARRPGQPEFYKVSIHGQRKCDKEHGHQIASIIEYTTVPLTAEDLTGETRGDRGPWTVPPGRGTDPNVTDRPHQPQQSTESPLADPAQPPSTNEARMALAFELLERFRLEVTASQAETNQKYEAVLLNVAELVGAGTTDFDNERLAQEMNALPRLFNSTLVSRGSQVNVRYFKGVYEARTRDKSRRIRESGKKLFPLSCEPLREKGPVPSEALKKPDRT